MIHEKMLPDLALEPGTRAKWQALWRRLQTLDGAVVAFSGGVDSSLLAAAAHLALAPRMMAVTIRSEVETGGLMAAAAAVAEKFGFPHQFVDYQKLQDAAYVENSPQRCYVCKSVDLGIIGRVAQETGLNQVLIGAIAEDASDYRPGMRAAAELGTLSPLAEVGLVKTEVRQIARALGLPNWNLPSSPCLASRIPYGSPVTRQKLEQVAAGEAYLRTLGFEVARVRNNETTARIEVKPDQIERLVSLRELVSGYFKQLGFKYVSVDLDGYRTGSLNEALAA